ncbi:MAG: class II glutamine amidotransferase [Oscillospiraceae bacterium]|nr:class II glutamine amidotransferase [Oscillospiraceae bacterium]
MCELLGFSAREQRDLSPWLRIFFSHGAQNPNGWGLARNIEGTPVIDREPQPASASVCAAAIASQPQPQVLSLAHLRKATVGDVSLENCHPLYRRDRSGRGWLLVHNGTVFTGLSSFDYQGRTTGSTDSEWILLYLLDRLDGESARKGRALSDEERFTVLEAGVSALSYRNKMNLLLSDGELLYAHANMRDTLFYKKLPGSILIATVPLDDRGWAPVPLTRLLAYRQGQLLYEGAPHGKEYVSGLERLPLDLDFAI